MIPFSSIPLHFNHLVETAQNMNTYRIYFLHYFSQRLLTTDMQYDII